VKQGAVVVDVGIHRTDSGIIGDVAADQLQGHAAGVTPVPGGVGPMTIAELMQNTWQAFVQGAGQ
jgi:methylenetetrahydrofolate dehydrogenase (NADP+)/methenyltetrahydrofolate cyclohydrolase